MRRGGREGLFVDDDGFGGGVEGRAGGGGVGALGDGATLGGGEGAEGGVSFILDGRV